MEQKNPGVRKKGERLLFYRNEKTGVQHPRERKIKGQIIEEMVDEVQKVYYSEDDVNNFSLETFGIQMPYRAGNKTIIENYLLDFWQAIMGFEAVMTYINYLRRCIDNNMPFVSLENMARLMGTTAQTLNKYITTLEQHQFAMRFWAQNPQKNHMNSSTRVKIRSGIPFLSEQQINELPEDLQAQHDEFLMKLMESYEIILPEDNDHNQELTEFFNRGRSKPPARRRIVTNLPDYNERRRKIYEKQQTESDIQIWNEIMTHLSKTISKSSIDTWLKGSFFHCREDHLSVFTLHHLAKEWVNDRYKNNISQSFEETQGRPCKGITIYCTDLTGNEAAAGVEV